jgi:tripartite-type tricarboxylate transporter receptor subunit TctC
MMNEERAMKRKLLLAAFAATVALPGIAAAQGFPNHTVRLISGVTPGSASDTMARILAEKMQASLGQPVIVENWLGAGGLVGASRVAKTEPDGHTVMIYASAFTIAPLINPGVLDPKDLVPVATIATTPTVLVVRPDRGWKKAADLVAAAKAKPGGIVAASAGIGSATHMNLERFRLSAGIQVLHVPLKGAAEALTEVLTGRADLYFALPFQVKGPVQEGKLVALAVGSPKRSSLFPDVPTTVEAGYANSDYNFWVGALVPAKTPRDIVLRLNKEIDRAVNLPDVHERILKLGADPLSMSIPEFEAMIRKEFEENAKLVKETNMKVN